jgi:hypothetical protein
MQGKFSEYKISPYADIPPRVSVENPKDKWLTWDDMQKVLRG